MRFSDKLSEIWRREEESERKEQKQRRKRNNVSMIRRKEGRDRTRGSRRGKRGGETERKHR